MNQEPRPTGASRDGLAAVAVIIITAALIALVISQIV